MKFFSLDEVSKWLPSKRGMFWINNYLWTGEHIIIHIFNLTKLFDKSDALKSILLFISHYIYTHIIFNNLTIYTWYWIFSISKIVLICLENFLTFLCVRELSLNYISRVQPRIFPRDMNNSFTKSAWLHSPTNVPFHNQTSESCAIGTR